MEVRVVAIPGHCELEYEPAEWAGSLVVVEAGEIELECRSGRSAFFDAGSVLFFDGLGLRAVRNNGGEPVLLSAVSRRKRHQPATEPPKQRGLRPRPVGLEGGESSGVSRRLDL